ncbi:MAG: dihydroorotate dehydrogenase electron transfer subunit [Oscillospiraceae bacterium]|jgi:dihydroorotate dehydrogenase electron transfer subunit|nr:dihydroorotate dehydrogenase electron transfer subunit [Oscillospiraceae bacterium]
MAKQVFARILENRLIAAAAYSMLLECPALAREAQIGQFVHVLCGDKPLRRPISVCRVREAELTLVYAVRGEGTAWLAERTCGETLDILGALGNGFPLLDASARLLVVGGGIGVPPLLDCAIRGGAGHVDAVLGFRAHGQVILEEEFAAACAGVASNAEPAGSVTVCTEDGSYGTGGRVTVPMEELLRKNQYGAVYSCGPLPMLKAVAETAAKYAVPCRVSLEERMGCGVGACLVCSAKIRRNGTEEYLRVCKEGPVFNAEEVCWE